MENSSSILNDLHRRYLVNNLSAEETEQFFALIREPGNEALLKEYMDAHWDAQFDGISRKTAKTKVLPVWFRVVAAAMVLLVMSGVIYQLTKKKPASHELSQKERFKNDVQPGTDKAMLKLADGSVIMLDSTANGKLAIHGQQQITNKDGALYYNKISSGNSGVLYNDVITPAGGQYKLTLADGTKVWLDALSSIHFPTSFPGERREVEITGQVYFEVAPRVARGLPAGRDEGRMVKTPFIVKIKNRSGNDMGIVEVLGTHFNINAYDNEAGTKTTLAEGAVRITQKSKTLLLQPGQQAFTDEQGNLQLLTNPDMQETLAWKDGLFYYNGANIETIMKQISRWYGVEVVYKDQVKETFVAEIPRYVPLSTLLALLELTRQVHFKIEGKTITVTQ